MFRTLSASEKERLIFGNWEYDDDPATLIEYEKILDIWQNKHVLRLSRHYITCDVVRYGRDSSKVCVWDGWRVVDYKTYRGLSVPEVSQKVWQAMTQYRVPASQVVVDDDGVGGGVTDMVGAKGFINNSRPMEEKVPQGSMQIPNYENLRSQCYFRLADRIMNAGLYVEPGVMNETEIEELIEELEQVKQQNMDAVGKKGIVPKDLIKKMISRSPDNSDVFMMREYFELTKPPTGQARTYRIPMKASTF